MPDSVQDNAKDPVLKWIDLVIDQTNDLWTISLAFFAAAVLVLAHLHSREAARLSAGVDVQTWRSPPCLFVMLYSSAASTAISLFMAYKVKGSLISGMSQIAQDHTWQIPAHTELNSLIQFLSFMTGILLFIFTFGFYRRVVGGALIGALKGG